MNEQKFIKNLRLEGTILDRRRKLPTQEIYKIKDLYRAGKSIKDISNACGLKPTAVRKYIDPDFRKKCDLASKEAYYKRTKQERAQKNFINKQSTFKYKKQLYTTLIENLNT